MFWTAFPTGAHGSTDSLPSGPLQTAPRPLEWATGYPRPLGRSPTLLFSLGISAFQPQNKNKTQTRLSQLCSMQANNNINSPNQRQLTWPSAQESCHEKWALTRRPGVGSSQVPRTAGQSPPQGGRRRPCVSGEAAAPSPAQGSAPRLCDLLLDPSARGHVPNNGPHPPPSTNIFLLKLTGVYHMTPNGEPETATITQD